MVGLNIEMGRELLWRGFPADRAAPTSTGSGTRAARRAAAGHRRRHRRLGRPRASATRRHDAPGDDERFVLLMRSDLLRRYPNARRSTPPSSPACAAAHGAAASPRLSAARCSRTCASSASTSGRQTRDARRLARIVIQEQPTEPRFGLEVGTDTGVGHPPAGRPAAERRRGSAGSATPPACPCGSRCQQPSLLHALIRCRSARAPTCGTRCSSRGPPSPPRPSCRPSWAASDVPLALLPVRLETRFFPRRDGTRAARARLSRQDPHRLARAGAHRRTSARGASASGSSAGAPATTSRRRAPGLAAARRPLRRAARRLDRARAAADQRRPRGRRQPVDAARAARRSLRVLRRRRPAATAPRTPLARLLPDRWIAVGLRRRRAGRDRDRAPSSLPLAVGPDPKRRSAAADRRRRAGDRRRHALDGRLRRGRGARHGAAHAARRRRRRSASTLLLVFGVRGTLATHRRPAALAALLDAHHYTDGLAFLRPGTPTNNTADEPLGVQQRRPARRRSYAERVAPAPAPRRPARRRARTARRSASRRRAATCWAASAGAGAAPTTRRAADMADRAVAGDLGLLPHQHDRLRRHGLDARRDRLGARHFIATCAAAGRCRRCAAGASPTACCRSRSLGRLWQPPAGEEVAHAPLAWLRTLLQRLRDKVWRRTRCSRSPRLGAQRRRRAPTSADVHARPTRSRRATPMRPLMGRHYVQHLRAFLGEDLDAAGWLDRAAGVARSGLLQRLELLLARRA